MADLICMFVVTTVVLKRSIFHELSYNKYIVPKESKLLKALIRCNLVLQMKVFLCLTRLNPCVAHCSTDSIPWVYT
jgi:hypothetical protein